MKELIFLGFMNGSPVSIVHKETGQIITGRVMGINLESGYQPGECPKHFLVDLCNGAELIKNVYVRG